MSPQIEEITDNGSNLFTPTNTGRHVIDIGSNSADVAFDSGTVTLTQNGIAVEDVNGDAIAASAPARFVTDAIIGDEECDFAVTSVAGAAANIDIKIYKTDPTA